MEPERINRLDIALALVLTGLGVLITLADGAPGPLDTLLVGSVTIPVIWRRSQPLAAAVALAAGMVTSGIPSFDQTRCGVAIPAALLVLFSLGARQERDAALIGLVALLAGFVFLIFTDSQLDPGAAFILPLGAGVWGAGRWSRSRSLVAAEISDRSREIERTREEVAQLAADVERGRLASEIDVAASERIRSLVSLASDGESDATQSPEEARKAFGRIETEGRESLNEVRDLLGVLRSDERDTSPRPTLAQLETLLGQARVGGSPVELGIEGAQRALPGGVELAAYRMIQHALEAFAGADAGRAQVRVRYLERSLELEVNGSLPDGDPTVVLAAARERVTAHGGTFDTVSEGAGRLTVRAELPLARAGA